MPDRPKIPHDPLPDSSNNAAKRWTRKLAEAGKFTSLGKRIPHYGPPRYRRVNEQDRPQGLTQA